MEQFSPEVIAFDQVSEIMAWIMGIKKVLEHPVVIAVDPRGPYPDPRLIGIREPEAVIKTLDMIVHARFNKHLTGM